MKALLFFIALALPCAGAELTAQQQALAYLQLLPPDTKFYVWAERLKPYELIGDEDANRLSESVISDFNARHPGFPFIAAPFFPPLMSIFAYRSAGGADYAQQFAVQSKASSSLRAFVSSHRIDDQPCAFTSFLDRDTWAVEGIVFLDVSRLNTPDLQRECVASGLDYVAGFPTASHFDYRQFPAENVRSVIVDAILNCSAEGKSEQPDPERSKDVTALPSRDCVIGKLSQ